MSPVWFHHCIDLNYVRYDTIESDPSFSDRRWWGKSYDWLASQVGFYPIFVAVGIPSDILMTGYQDNWRRHTGGEMVDGQWVKHFRKKGEYPNRALFSFRHLEGIFTDYSAWHLALNAYSDHPSEPLKEHEVRMIFKRSWDRARWLRYARERRSDVQLVVPRIDLRQSCRVLVRNKATQSHLLEMGFKNVQVKRISCVD